LLARPDRAARGILQSGVMSGAPDIHAELVTAILRARHPCVAALLAPLRLPLGFSRHLMTGVGRVEFFRAGRITCYQPAEDGRRALIVAVQETLFSTLNELVSLDPVTGIGVETAEPAGREVVDLCAVDLLTQQVGTRLGIGTVLGRDAIDDVRFNGGVLRLLDQPFDWLREPTGSAFILDWTIAAFILADLDRPVTTLADQPIEVRCSMTLAERVERAFRRPLARPNLRVAA
jgi:hypothetical protein